MKSKNYKYWKSELDKRQCSDCDGLHGKIYDIYEQPKPKPPLHFRCRCKIEILDALRAGTVTEKKTNGADWWLKYKGVLPDYYITEKSAKQLGFVPRLGNLHEVAPNKMITKSPYKNKNGHLPNADGRVWIEADLNYKFGFRNDHRILFSNDGLIFVTYDHYKTFIEII